MRIRAIVVALLVVLVGGSAFAALKLTSGAGREEARSCPKGFVTREQAAARERHTEIALGHKPGKEDGDREAEPEERKQGECVPQKKPESYAELAAANSQLASRSTAPFKALKAGAYEHAVAQKAQLVKAGSGGVAGADGNWSPYGDGPLITDNTDYDQSNGSTREGFGTVAGRTSDFAYDAPSGKLWAAASNGGIWESSNLGDSWHSIGDNLPTQVVSSVKYSPAGGGTLLVLTGDGSFGFDSESGLGVYRSTDDGASWQKAGGIPDRALGFKLAVDPTNPSIVYAATGLGLFRSTDAGASFTNVNLPTGDGVDPGQPDCTGDSSIEKGCYLANVVTDVVVQDSPHAPITGTGGAVMAAVGWRAGNKLNDDGTIESPNNGVYVSDDGTPGTFTKVAPTSGSGDFPNQDKVGRTELGIANGPDQDHKIVYAVIEDAQKFRGGIPGIDAEGSQTGAPYPSVFDAVYVTKDFGQTWTQLEDWMQLGTDPTSGSSLFAAGCAQLYCPGVQAWYNEWIQPDPLQQTASGVPTRVMFGLEEVWSSKNPGSAQDNALTKFKVIGRYFGGDTCAFLNSPLPVCPTNNPPTPSSTTHPDQHGSIVIPDGSGGETLVVGNDGGVYKQHVASGEDFDNTKWGRGANEGFHTLQPYDAEMAKDGTVYAGLQDNGEMKILADGRQYGVYGGDGFFSAVDPDNSGVAYEEYTGGDISVTTDGGKNWTDIAPPFSAASFSNPFKMDPTDAKHLMAPGREVFETVYGPDTTSELDGSKDWNQVFDLGTRKSPGTSASTSGSDDSDNKASALDLKGDKAYVAYCGFCDVMTEGRPFESGIATNVGGSAPAKRMTSDGWHIAAANGLPERYVTGVAMDPANPSTVYVTLGGYGRHWAPPGAVREDTSKVGTGHVFRSTDAGEHFTDVTGNLPDVSADSIVVRGGQLVVGTDIGTFISNDPAGSTWAVLGSGLPSVPVFHLSLKPGDDNTLVAATYGRGVYTYKFADAAAAAASGGNGKGSVCAATAGFRGFSATYKGGNLRVGISRRSPAGATVEVFRHSLGERRAIRKTLVKRFRNRKRSFDYRKRLADGIYSVRAGIAVPGSHVRDYRSRTFEVKHGRYHGMRDFYGHGSCGTIRSFKLSSPAFGGSTQRGLQIAYRLARSGTVTVTVKRARTITTRFKAMKARAHRTYRLNLAARGLRRGTYSVTVTARSGRSATSQSLASTRL